VEPALVRETYKHHKQRSADEQTSAMAKRLEMPCKFLKKIEVNLQFMIFKNIFEGHRWFVKFLV
jgi:hypothetical protein